MSPKQSRRAFLPFLCGSGIGHILARCDWRTLLHRADVQLTTAYDKKLGFAKLSDDPKVLCDFGRGLDINSRASYS